MRRLLLLAGLAGALLSPGAAAARDVVVTPEGTGAACTAAAPCGLFVASTAAGAADVIRLGAGTYGAPDAPLPALRFAAEVRGAVIGRGRPVVHTAGARFDGRAQDLEVRGGGIVVTGKPVTRVVSRRTSAGAGFACDVDGGWLLDALCLAPGATAGGGLRAGSGAIVRNVTAVSSADGLVLAAAGVDVSNTIARGNTGGGPLARDLVVQGSSAGTRLAAVAWDTVSGTPPTGATRIAMPAFSDGVDYRVPAGQPTIGTGSTTGVGDEELDVDGNARAIDDAGGAGRPDVGAYELVGAAPVVGAADATGVGDAEATMRAALATQGGQTRYRFEWGTTTAYGRTTTEVPQPGLPAVTTVGVGLTGLTPGTTYHYRLLAANDAGETVGPDQTFTTTGTVPAPPQDPTPPATNPLPPATTPPPTATPAPTPPPATGSLRATLRPGEAARLARLLRRGRVVSVTVRCGGRPCDVTLRAAVRGVGRLLTPRALPVSADGTGRIGILSTAALRRKVRRSDRKRFVLVLRATFDPAEGKTVTQRKTVVLRR